MDIILIVTLGIICLFINNAVRDYRKKMCGYNNVSSWTISNSELLKLRNSRLQSTWNCLVVQAISRWMGYFVDAYDNDDYEWILMYLHFRCDGTIKGYGSDAYGRFNIYGVYGNRSQLEVVIIQHYPEEINIFEGDLHYRYYRGIVVMDKNGAYTIQGEWQMDDRAMNTYHGTFCIVRR